MSVREKKEGVRGKRERREICERGEEEIKPQSPLLQHRGRSLGMRLTIRYTASMNLQLSKHLLS